MHTKPSGFSLLLIEEEKLSSQHEAEGSPAKSEPREFDENTIFLEKYKHAYEKDIDNINK